MAEDGFEALVAFWSAQGTAMLDAQQSMARSMMEGFKTQAPDADVGKAAAAMAELWMAATGLSTDLAHRLTQATGGAGTDWFERIADPRQWMAGTGGLDDVLAGLADAPRLADLFDVERRCAGVMHRWNELRQCTLEHQRMLLETWMRVGQAYSTALAGQTLEPQQALALWTKIGNRTVVEAQRSEPYLVSQRALIRASTALRVAQSELSEHIGKQFGLPTRTEIDDVHRSMTEMRRELRRVRRELDAAKAVQPAATITAHPASIPVSLPSVARSGKSARRKGR